MADTTTKVTILDAKINIDDSIKALASLRQEIDALKKSQKENKKATEEERIEYEANDIEIKKLTSNYNGLKKGVEATTNATNKNTDATDNSGLSYAQLSAQVSKMEKEYKNMQGTLKITEDGTVEITKEFEDLAKNIASGRETLRNFDLQLNNFGRNVGNYPAQIGQAEQSNSKFAKSFEYVKKNWAEFVTGFNQGFQLVMQLYGYFKQFYGLMNENNKNKRDIKNILGFDGQDADAIMIKINTLKDLYGVEFKDVLQTANALSKDLGISANIALDKIGKGFQNGSNISGSFLQDLKEFSPQFKAVGMSADQSFDIMSKFSTEGIFGNKGADAIKEAGIRLTELNDNTKAALVSIGISNVEIAKRVKDGTINQFEFIQEIAEKTKVTAETNSIGAKKAISTIFGSQGEDAGVRLVDVIAKVGKTSEDVEPHVSALTKSVTELTSNYNTFLDIVTNGDGVVGEIFAKWVGYWSDMMANINAIIAGDWVNKLKGLINFLITPITTALGTVTKIISKITGKDLEINFKFDLDPIFKVNDAIDALKKSVSGMSATKAKPPIDEKAIERAKEINKQYWQSILNQLNDGREKEKQGIEQQYRERINGLNKNLKNEKDLAVELENELQKSLTEVDKKYNKEKLAAQLSAKQKNLENNLAAAKQGSDAELQLKVSQLQLQRDIEIKEATKLGIEKKGVIEKYNAQEATLRLENLKSIHAKEAEARSAEFERASIELSSQNEKNLELKKRYLENELENIVQYKDESDAQYLARENALNAQLVQNMKDIEAERINQLNTNVEITKSFANAITSIYELMGENASDNSEFMKAIALVQIGVETAVAIAKGISSAMSEPYPYNLVAAASTVAEVAALMLSAKKVLNAQKEPTQKSVKKAAQGAMITGNSHASGGVLIEAEGGEAIVNKKTMASPTLASIVSWANQMGGGVPLAATGVSVPIVNNSNYITFEQAIALIKSQPIQVAVSEIKEVSTTYDNRVNKAKVF
jgi:Phage-related minor tail protein